jgi:Ca2+-binding RTX toxin-like protein
LVSVFGEYAVLWVGEVVDTTGTPSTTAPITPVNTTGDNSYIVNAITDVVIEQPNNGWDVVKTNVNNYTLPDNVEVLMFGTAVSAGTGNAQNNYLLGNSLDNTIDGRLGNDVMAGYAGNDTYFVDSTNINAEWTVDFAMGDVVVEGANEGIDTVNASVSYVLRANIENLVLTGNTIGGGGNALNNIITGNAADNILNGGAGVDTVIGGAGNDQYFVDETNDVTTELGGEGSDIVFSTATNYALNINVENLIVWGAGLNGTGNAGDNIIYGNALNNTLTDGAGSDILVGGRGQDTYNMSVDNTIDTLYFNAGDSLVTGYDQANNFSLGTDRLNLPSTTIATNAIVNGVNAGTIMSHSISNGIISFGSTDSFTAPPVTITATTNLANVLAYLQNNITGGNTVAFVANGSTFVFQDGGVNDTLIELVGVTASSINNTGLGVGSVWVM